MLVPKRVKHRKVQRGSMKGKAKGGTRLNHGEYGIQPSRPTGSPTVRSSSSYCHDPSHEAWRQGLDHDLPRQAHHLQARRDRMGSGKGNPEAGSLS